MTEFVVAHKFALILIGLALGGFVLFSRGKGGTAGAGTGYPVSPYASNAKSDGGGGFSLGSLLPAGPAGPILDPAVGASSSAAPAAPEAMSSATTNEAPAAVNNSPVLSQPEPPPSTISSTYIAGQDNPTYLLPGGPGEAPSYFTPTGWFQNEQGFKTVSPGLFEPGGLYFNPPPPEAPRTLSSGPGGAPAVSLPISDPIPFTPRATIGHAVAV